MATALELIASKERVSAISRNEYNSKGEYGSTNANALSDGDNKGKGTSADGSVGSLKDINTRKDNLGRNPYNSDKGYGVGHGNALSDGDEKGKGEVDGSIGSLKDINTRKDNLGRNSTYGPNKKSYPDFVI